jgi:DNA-directed RNA polymerase subunit RPC12/RpoP
MKEFVIELEVELTKGQYRVWYRCTNCGIVFQHDMRKGQPTTKMDGECPMCGCKSGTAGIGAFDVVKYNHEIYDKRPRHYFM